MSNYSKLQNDNKLENLKSWLNNQNKDLQELTNKYLDKDKFNCHNCEGGVKEVFTWINSYLGGLLDKINKMTNKEKCLKNFRDQLTKLYKNDISRLIKIQTSNQNDYCKKVVEKFIPLTKTIADLFATLGSKWKTENTNIKSTLLATSQSFKNVSEKLSDGYTAFIIAVREFNEAIEISKRQANEDITRFANIIYSNNKKYNLDSKINEIPTPNINKQKNIDIDRLKNEYQNRVKDLVFEFEERIRSKCSKLMDSLNEELKYTNFPQNLKNSLTDKFYDLLLYSKCINNKEEEVIKILKNICNKFNQLGSDSPLFIKGVQILSTELKNKTIEEISELLKKNKIL